MWIFYLQFVFFIIDEFVCQHKSCCYLVATFMNDLLEFKRSAHKLHTQIYNLIYHLHIRFYQDAAFYPNQPVE